MTKIAFQDIAKCSLVEVSRRFRGAYYFHQQSDVSPSLVRCIVLMNQYASLKHRCTSTRLHIAIIFHFVPNWSIGPLSGFLDHTHTDTR
jgi:hypothetical protein